MGDKHDVCSNWWPLLDSTKIKELNTTAELIAMPHYLCQYCANWMIDIEDIGSNGVTIQVNSVQKQSKCINQWPSQKN